MKEADIEKMNEVNHDFWRRFYGPKGEWRWTGSDLFTKIRWWADKYPKDVFFQIVDDDHHALSCLVFILHRIGKKNWGTTVIYAPQNGTPVSYFMYPNRTKEIATLLKKVAKYEELS